MIGTGANVFPSWLQPRSVSSTLGNGLLHYWNLDETSGARADSVGSLNLADNNTVGYVAGKNGNAATFVAADADSLSVSPGTELQISSSLGGTVSFWLMPPDSGNMDCVLQKGTGYFSTGEYMATWTAIGSVLKWYVVGGTGNWASFSMAGQSSVLKNAWHNIICWYDPSTKKANMSVDGGNVVVGAAISAPYNSTTAFQIGNVGGGSLTTGSVDEVAFWNRNLTSDERTELYNAGAGKFYPF